MNDNELKTLNFIAQTLFDKKGFNILVLDVRGISTMTDFCVIAEGNVDRHVKALAMTVRDELKKLGRSSCHMEGDHSSDWIVLDYGDVIIHLFTPEMREKYNLEDLWKKGQVVDVKIDIPKGKNHE
jgi:ribosome-associated protein